MKNKGKSLKSNPLVKQIPNLLTMTNMGLGLLVIFSIICGYSENYQKTGAILILIGVGIDAFDGKIARRLNSTTELGKQLDSFADIVTFGIAPISILFSYQGFRHNVVFFIILALYPMAGAFRLARYNIGDFRHHFIGLPITAAGAVMAIYLLIIHYNNIYILNGAILLVLILSFLMVSKFKIKRI